MREFGSCDSSAWSGVDRASFFNRSILLTVLNGRSLASRDQRSLLITYPGTSLEFRASRGLPIVLAGSRIGRKAGKNTCIDCLTCGNDA